MKQNTITVEGRGRLRVEPDIAVIGCSLSAWNQSYTEANRQMNKRSELLKSVLPDVGFQGADLKTTNFTVHRESRIDPKTREYTLYGYEARHSMELRLPLDRERLNRVMEAMLGSKSEAHVTVAFTVADPEPTRARLLAAAVENARNRAGTILQAAGAKLGAIANIVYGVTEVRFRSEDRFSLQESSPDAPGIIAGDYGVEDTVTVTWEIVQ